jgi:hypothetical protein
MKTILGLSLALLVAAPAQAAPKIPCMPTAKIEKDDAKTHVSKLTPGQRHFVDGAYFATPPLAPPPKGDGAILVQRDGEDGGVVMWTRGPLACGLFGLSEAAIKAMKDVKTGALDPLGDEL